MVCRRLLDAVSGIVQNTRDRPCDLQSEAERFYAMRRLCANSEAGPEGGAWCDQSDRVPG
jgi:hypothetical protein